MDYERARQAMVKDIASRGIDDVRVLAAMRDLPRHRFIPQGQETFGNPYGDHASPIGGGQTISQPFIVAYMTAKLGVDPGQRVLEIGSGSGYQSAVLAHCGVEVYAVELLSDLAVHARGVLAELDLDDKVHIRVGDGYGGWPDEAPFDGILAACAPPKIPPPFCEQLAEGGRLVIPVGRSSQRLITAQKRDGELHEEDSLPVRFVPLVQQSNP